MAYMISANMDQGAIDFQLEAAISKVVRLKLKGVLFHEQTEAVSLDYNMRACVICLPSRNDRPTLFESVASRTGRGAFEEQAAR